MYHLYASYTGIHSNSFPKQQYGTNRNQNAQVSHRCKLVSILNKRQWKEATIIGCALILGGQGLLAWGEQYLSSSVTALLFSTVPIWVLLLGKIVYREKLKKFTVLGVITGTVGFVILIFPSLGAQFVEIDTSNMKFEFVGIIALAIVAISWSVGSLYSSKADLPTNCTDFNWYDVICRWNFFNCIEYCNRRATEFSCICNFYAIHDFTIVPHNCRFSRMGWIFLGS